MDNNKISFYILIAMLIAQWTLGNQTQSTQKPLLPIKVGFLPALSANKGQNKHFVGAFQYALEDVNKRLKGLGYFIESTTMDNKGNTEETLRAMTTLYLKGTIAFIGPEDTCAIEARLASAWNIPMIAFKCRDSEVSNDKLYPTFARTIPSTSKVSKSVISLVKHFGWTRLQAVVGSSDEWVEAAKTLTKLAEMSGIDMNDDVYFEEPYIVPDQIPDIIEKTYKNTRIYVFMGDSHALIDFVRTMHSRNKNDGEYLVIAVQDEPYDPKNKLKFFKKYVEDLEVGMIDSFASVLMLLPRPPSNPNYDEFLVKSRRYSYEPPFNAPKPPYPQMKIPVPIFASYLYDAVNIYSTALTEVLQSGLDPRNGRDIIHRVKNRTYESIQGHRMYIDKDGDAEANYTVVALKKNESTAAMRSLQPVGYFVSNGKEIPEFHMTQEIDWVGGEVPSSEPQCGFDNSKCLKQPTEWPIAIACIIAASIMATAIVFSCRHYIYEQKISSLLWKIDYKDLVITNTDIVEPNLQEKTLRKFGRLSHLSNPDDASKDDMARGVRSAYTTVASYRGTLVSIKKLKKRPVELTRAVKKELFLMKEMAHDNVNRFIGACIEPPHICIVTLYCSRGSLKDILENEDIHLDDMFIASLVFDLIKGMIHLHESEIISHGNLKTTNCLVDSRWVLQISDFGLHSLRKTNSPLVRDEISYFEKLLWKAPELLRDHCPHDRGSQKGDVYSFALILYCIHSRIGEPWNKATKPYREIVEQLINCGGADDTLRPDTSHVKCEEFLMKCMEECWTEDPDQRPDFKYIRVRLKPMQSGLSASIFDNMLAIMEKYANTLESLVDERTMQLAQEKKTTEILLLRMLPKPVAEQLIRGEHVIPEHYECVTIYFSDIVGFTSLSAESTPMEVIDMLNDLYILFDSISESYDVYKVETIGDAYMVVSGLPIRNGDNHGGEIASMSLHLLRVIRDFRIRHRPSITLKLRIGIHSGPVVAGVVGLKMPRYCLFGDTVNTASRLESSGEPLKIHSSEKCKQLLDKLGGYITEPRGTVSMKGKGEMFTYFLTGEDYSHRRRRLSEDRPELFFNSDFNIQQFDDDLSSSLRSQILHDVTGLPVVIVTSSGNVGSDSPYNALNRLLPFQSKWLHSPS